MGEVTLSPLEGALDEAQAFRRQVDVLLAENAKLKELVRDMYEMAYPEYPSAFDAAFADRMRELGIEVTT